MLANLAMVECDRSLEGLATEEGLTYTRYSDDLCFSTDSTDFTRQSAERVVGRVYAVLSRTGLRPRTAKTAIIPAGARKVVLGLLVDGDRVRLTREFRRKLECHVHHIARHGPEMHARRRGFKSVLGLRRHLEGLLSYAATVDKDFASELRAKLTAVLWPI
jgi:hypothetical protein